MSDPAMSIQDQIRSTPEGFEVQDSFGQWHHVPASLQPAFGVIVQDGVLRPSAPGQEFADALDADGRAELEHLLHSHGVLDGPLDKAGTVQALHLVRLVGTALWKATASAAPESETGPERDLIDQADDMLRRLHSMQSICTKIVCQCEQYNEDIPLFDLFGETFADARELMGQLQHSLCGKY